jgi:hypothetical protein
MTRQAVALPQTINVFFPAGKVVDLQGVGRVGGKHVHSLKNMTLYRCMTFCFRWSPRVRPFVYNKSTVKFRRSSNSVEN